MHTHEFGGNGREREMWRERNREWLRRGGRRRHLHAETEIERVR